MTDVPDVDAPTTGQKEQWFVVDLDRIARLPQRLRCLWPRELMPRAGVTVSDVSDDCSASTPAGAHSAGEPAKSSGKCSGGESGTISGEYSGGEPGTSSAKVSGSLNDSVMLTELPDGGPSRGFDVLSAWLAGFAAELNLTAARMTVVISSGAEVVHLEVCLCEDTCLAVLALRGEGFDEFGGYELLRRIRAQDFARATDDLTRLVEHDCVLTLTYVTTGGSAGLEFLHRRNGVWYRPTLERGSAGITVGAEEDAGGDTVRKLLAATLVHLQTSATGK